MAVDTLSRAGTGHESIRATSRSISGGREPCYDPREFRAASAAPRRRSEAERGKGSSRHRAWSPLPRRRRRRGRRRPPRRASAARLRRGSTTYGAALAEPGGRADPGQGRRRRRRRAAATLEWSTGSERPRRVREERGEPGCRCRAAGRQTQHIQEATCPAPSPAPCKAVTALSLAGGNASRPAREHDRQENSPPSAAASGMERGPFESSSASALLGLAARCNGTVGAQASRSKRCARPRRRSGGFPYKGRGVVGASRDGRRSYGFDPEVRTSTRTRGNHRAPPPRLPRRGDRAIGSVTARSTMFRCAGADLRQSIRGRLGTCRAQPACAV